MSLLVYFVQYSPPAVLLLFLLKRLRWLKQQLLGLSSLPWWKCGCVCSRKALGFFNEAFTATLWAVNSDWDSVLHLQILCNFHFTIWFERQTHANVFSSNAKVTLAISYDNDLSHEPASPWRLVWRDKTDLYILQLGHIHQFVLHLFSFKRTGQYF